EEVFIILGDTVFEVDLKDVFKRNHSSLGVKTVDDPRRFGVAVMNNGSIKHLVEKPETPISNLALVGLYYVKNTALLYECLDYEIKNEIRTRGEFQLTDALQMMIERGESFTTFPVEGWYDCGKPETLLSTNQVLLKTKARHKDVYNCVINPPVFIAEDAVIENSVIGPFATIASKAVVKDSVIRNSIIGDLAKVSGLLLDESIVGNNAVLIGNFRKINVGDSSEIDFR
ncbi:MAG: nucleotidyl transferase, partial [Chlorobiales bacterium]|nr:nucleotidyl transferase [Chlorobiales bacterium]